METFFFVYFHKDDIVPDLADTFPGNDIFIITSEQAAESSGAWKYKGGELTAFAVKFRINGTSETAAGTDIYYFFFLLFTDFYKSDTVLPVKIRLSCQCFQNLICV